MEVCLSALASMDSKNDTIQYEGHSTTPEREVDYAMRSARQGHVSGTQRWCDKTSYIVAYLKSVDDGGALKCSAKSAQSWKIGLIQDQYLQYAIPASLNIFQEAFPRATASAYVKGLRNGCDFSPNTISGQSTFKTTATLAPMPSQTHTPACIAA